VEKIMLTKDEELFMRGQVSGVLMARYPEGTDIKIDDITEIVVGFANIAVANAEAKKVSTTPEVRVTEAPEVTVDTWTDRGGVVHPKKTKTTGPDKILTTEEAAKILMMGAGTLAAWRKKGKGPKFSKEGKGKYSYRQGDVRKWARMNPKVIERALKMSGAMKRAYVKKAQREGPKAPSTFPAEIKL